MKLLLKNGADTESKNMNGKSPLHNVSHDCHFLEKGANIEVTDAYYNTSLHLASDWGELKTVKLLLENGANINSKNTNGWTPLHHASWSCHLEIVKLLVENGADIEAKNNFGVKPVDLAYDAKIITFFKEYEKAIIIQSFFRIIVSKSLANKLRSEPDNLFDPEFSKMRKRMLKIDDSCFK